MQIVYGGGLFPGVQSLICLQKGNNPTSANYDEETENKNSQQIFQQTNCFDFDMMKSCLVWQRPFKFKKYHPLTEAIGRLFRPVLGWNWTIKFALACRYIRWQFEDFRNAAVLSPLKFYEAKKCPNTNSVVEPVSCHYRGNILMLILDAVAFVAFDYCLCQSHIQIFTQPRFHLCWWTAGCHIFSKPMISPYEELCAAKRAPVRADKRFLGFFIKLYHDNSGKLSNVAENGGKHPFKCLDCPPM